MNTIDQVLLHRTDTLDAKNFLRIQWSFVQLGTQLDALAIFDQKSHALGNRVSHFFITVIGDESDLVLGFGLFNADATIRLTNRAGTLGVTSFEEFGHPGKTLGDVIS